MVQVRVPATIANLGPAFDTLGVAVSLYNTIEMDVASQPRLDVIGEGEGWIPTDPSNLTYRAATAVGQRVGERVAFRIRSHNRIPLGRGLGSSAAAIVGGVVAANETLGKRLGFEELLELAWRLEGHPDNVAAALCGGVVMTCPANGRLAWTQITPAWRAALVVAVPEFAVPTTQARAVLPERVPLHDAVANISRCARLVTAMLTGRVELLALAMEDALHQPYRRTLVPGMDEVFAAAREAGAYGAALSGAGPSVVAITPPEAAEEVGARMVAAFEAAGSRAKSLQVEIDRVGAIPLPAGSS